MTEARPWEAATVGDVEGGSGRIEATRSPQDRSLIVYHGCLILTDGFMKSPLFEFWASVGDDLASGTLLKLDEDLDSLCKGFLAIWRCLFCSLRDSLQSNCPRKGLMPAGGQGWLIEGWGLADRSEGSGQ